MKTYQNIAHFCRKLEKPKPNIIIFTMWLRTMDHSKHVWSRRGRTILLNSSFLLAKWILKHIYFICCLLIPAFPRVFSQIVNDFIVEEVKMVEPLHDQQGCWHLEGLCSVSVGWTLDLPRSIELEFTVLDQTCNRWVPLQGKSLLKHSGWSP